MPRHLKITLAATGLLLIVGACTSFLLYRASVRTDVRRIGMTLGMKREPGFFESPHEYVEEALRAQNLIMKDEKEVLPLLSAATNSESNKTDHVTVFYYRVTSAFGRSNDVYIYLHFDAQGRVASWNVDNS